MTDSLNTLAAKDGARFTKRRVVTMILFCVVTLGLYYPIWFLRRRPALNSLDSPTKLAVWPFVTYIAVWVIQLAYGIARGEEAPDPESGTEVLLTLINIGSTLWVVFQGFRTRDILQDHLAGPDAEAFGTGMFTTKRTLLSGPMTFFFQIFYLQFVINRMIRTAHGGYRLDGVADSNRSSSPTDARYSV